jgi:hypothetical protein
VDGFMTSFAETIRNTKNPEDVRPPIPELPRSTHWIRETLKIAARELPRMEGNLAFKFGDYHERMFPFDPRKFFSKFDKGTFDYYIAMKI